ncbi:hypothetical protein Hsw_0574 [Hymenobacter swuensis DY53]|uniref:Uncharacterized protein n=1 Tax=Hymenobacter swuensis DY53 TaxID=1227739 RepID=W8ESN9_9BACT|nr:hypothetical protein Hsw_0574 [Hymenobacter swuensis DY53]
MLKASGLVAEFICRPSQRRSSLAYTWRGVQRQTDNGRHNDTSAAV